MGTTREKYPELYAMNKHLVQTYKERDHWKEQFLFLKDEFDLFKVQQKNCENPKKMSKRMRVTKRRNVTQTIRNYAIASRCKELGIKNVYTYKKLLRIDPCVSNETEFYKSYLDEFHIKNNTF